MKFSDRLIRAIYAVNQDVAYEIEFEGGESARQRDMILAEVCLDAGRLTTMGGSPESDAEVRELCEKHGYQAVLREAAKHVSQA